MISIVKYFYEVGDFSTYAPEQQGLLTGAYKYWTGGRTGADVKEMAKRASSKTGEEWAGRMREHMKTHVPAGTGAAGAANDMSGSEAAGIALKKGAQSAGEAVGSLGKKAAEFAGDNPGAAGLIAGGIGAAAILAARRKKAQGQ